MITTLYSAHRRSPLPQIARPCQGGVTAGVQSSSLSIVISFLDILVGGFLEDSEYSSSEEVGTMPSDLRFASPGGMDGLTCVAGMLAEEDMCLLCKLEFREKKKTPAVQKSKNCRVANFPCFGYSFGGKREENSILKRK